MVGAGDPLELGIDLASDHASLAVLSGETVLAERDWLIETTATRELLAGIEMVLREAGVERGAVTGIAVVVGPGGYSSLRASVATAQGLALALGIPLAGVSRLEVAALPHLDRVQPEHATVRPVVALHALSRGQLAWAAYSRAGEGQPPRELIAPRIDELSDCVAASPSRALWCGDLDGEVGALLRAAIDAAGRTGDTEAASTENRRRAADAVRLARLHHAYGDPADVDVLYLRAPSITPPRPRS